MKAFCKKSGLQLDISFFPGNLESSEFVHPIFYLPQKSLLSYTSRFFTGKLDEIDSYLYYLALLDSTDLLRWNCAARFTTNTPKICAANMEPLLKVIGRINIIKHPAFQLPQISINRDTCTLDNSYIWVKTWERGISDFLDGNRTQDLMRQLQRREASLEKLIKNPDKPIQQYIHHLAAWAEQAAAYPNMRVSHDGINMSLADYWRKILFACANNTAWKFPQNDLKEFQQWLLDNLEAGTIYSHTIHKLLDHGLNQNSRLFGFTGNVTYKLLDENEQLTVEQQNLKAMAIAAPLEKPSPEQFRTKFEYLQTLARYNEAKRQAASSGDIDL